LTASICMCGGIYQQSAFPARRLHLHFDRPMKIAQIAPLAESVPPSLYGGTERVVSYLTEELVRLGHEVTLFASGDSQTEANLVACAPRALRLDPGAGDPLPHHLLMLERVRRRAFEFDVLHFHTEHLQLPLFRAMARKAVTTLHGPPRPAGPGAAVPRVPRNAAGLDFRKPAPAAGRGELGRHRVPRAVAGSLPVQPRPARRLPRVHRPRIAGKGPRARHRDRAPLGSAACASPPRSTATMKPTGARASRR
jgi:glycosyltransferase involved in cell wall biosynthesis